MLKITRLSPLFALLIACGSSGSEPTTTTEANDAPPMQAPSELLAGPAEIDVQAVMDRAHFAFRSGAEGWRAGHSTHTVIARADAVSVTPHKVADAATRATVSGSTWTLHTAGIFRGADRIDAPATELTTSDSGTLLARRGSIVAEVVNSYQGVEQQWLFERKPAGSGDVVVRQSVEGLAYVGITPEGTHFADESGLGFRYGNAYWVDADGRTSQVAVDYSEGVDGQYLAIIVPEALVESARYPVVLDPTITAEDAVDNPISGTSVGTTTSDPAVASSGSQYLVVWTDFRSNFGDADVFATRVSTTGAVLDANGIAVGSTSDTNRTPAVAFANGRYVVAWEDDRSGASVDIQAATVGTDGSLTALGAVITTNTSTESDLSMAGGGGTALLAWEVDSDIRGSVFNGATFGPATDLVVAGTVQAEPDVAFDPGTAQYLVAYTEGTSGSDIFGVRVNLAGGVTAGPFAISDAPGGQSQAAVAFEPTDGTFFVVFANNNAGLDVFGTRVSTANVVLDTTDYAGTLHGGVPISQATNTQTAPDVACNGISCLVVWQDRRNFATAGNDVFGHRLNRNFTLAGDEFTLSGRDGNENRPSLASAGSDWFAAWIDNRAGGPGYIFGTRVNASSSVLNPSGILLSRNNNRQAAPAIGRAAGLWYVVWSDSRSIGNDIMGARVGNAGAVVDGSAKVVSGGPAHEARPALSHNGTDYFAVWSDSRNGVGNEDVFGARVDGARTVLSTTPVSTGANRQLLPAIASDGSGYLAVWQDRRNGNFDIFGAVIDASGNVVTSDIPICVNTLDQQSPRVAYDASAGQYVVAWSDGRGGNAQKDIFAARVSSGGAVLDVCGVPVSTGANSQLSPDVAAGGGQVLVVWSDNRDAGTGPDVRATRLTAGGSLTVLDGVGTGIAVSTGTQIEDSPRVAFTDGRFVVVWTDTRDFATNGFDVYGASVDGTGAVLDPSGFAVSANVEDETEPDIEAGPDKNVVVSYEKYRSDLRTSRVQVRKLTFGGGGGQACSAASQCETGFCVDGVCCESECGGGARLDCQVCSVARGSSADGVCDPRPAGGTCRIAVDICDRVEVCDGVSTECPADIPAPTTKECRRQIDFTCDRTEFCDGVNVACVADDLGKNEGIVCDASCGAVCPANDVGGIPHECPACP